MIKITFLLTLMLTAHMAYAEDTNLESKDSDTKSGRGPMTKGGPSIFS